MRFKIIDPTGGEVRNLINTGSNRHLGDLVCDKSMGSILITSGNPITCFSDPSLTNEIEVLKVEGISNGPGYIRTDILEPVD